MVKEIFERRHPTQHYETAEDTFSRPTNYTV